MMTARELQILRAIVNEYTSSAQPVGSRLLMTRYGFGISPATIRGVMSGLTEAGYLTQPHTSAGRVPTDRAYRLFLEQTEAARPSLSEQDKIAARLKQAAGPLAAFTVLAAQLAESAGAAAVVVSPQGVSAQRLTNIFGQPGLEDPRVSNYLAELIDQAAEWLPRFADQEGKLAIRIGQENDDFRATAVSILGISVTIAGQPHYLAVIGPTRMPYRKLTSLFEFGLQHWKETHGQA